MKEQNSALKRMEGGGHYLGFVIQPAEFCHVNNIGFIPGCIIKYACRYDKKGTPIQDLKKIIHFAEILIELIGKAGGVTPNAKE